MASRPIRNVWLGRGATLKELVAWNDRLWNTGGSGDINLIFAGISFITPFAMLFIAHQVRLFSARFPEVRFTISDFEHLGYAAHRGFFAALGADYGKGTGEAPGDLNYLPVTVVETRAFLETNGFNRINEAVDLEAGRLARVLTRRGSGATFQVVQYSLREIMRNVFEHSGSKTLTYCAQCWRGANRVQLAISDEGMGIHSSLTNNPRFKAVSSRDSLHFACMPGVSGNFKALTNPDGDVWTNSGYGLYMTSRLCRNSGGFLLMSSDHMVVLGEGRKVDFPVRHFRGTLVRLDLAIDWTNALAARLERYAAEGRILAREIAGAQVVEASRASQMLSDDFERLARPPG